MHGLFFSFVVLFACAFARPERSFPPLAHPSFLPHRGSHGIVHDGASHHNSIHPGVSHGSAVHHGNIYRTPHKTPVHHDSIHQAPHKVSVHHNSIHQVPHKTSVHHDNIYRTPHKTSVHHESTHQAPHKTSVHHGNIHQVPHKTSVHHDNIYQAPHKTSVHHDSIHQTPHKTSVHHKNTHQASQKTSAHHNNIYHIQHHSKAGPVTKKVREGSFAAQAPDSGDTKVPSNYDFGYGVQDDVHGTNFAHSESSDGHRTEGEYRVNLPDGRVQKVSYYVDELGYHPTVTYEGEAQFPKEDNAPKDDYH